MSKIQFHKDLKNKIEEITPLTDDLKTLIKDYINSLEVLPSMDIAVKYVMDNNIEIIEEDHLLRSNKTEQATIDETIKKLGFDKHKNTDGTPKCPQQ